MILQSEKRDKLNEAVLICKLHSERMQFAWQKIQTHFPLDKNKYIQLKREEISFFDQLIFRFSKLQDGMGEKLFPAILEILGEEIKGLPFIDRLGKLEELEIIPSAEDWLVLQETRNIITHEYPFITDEVIQGLNLLNKHYLLLIKIEKQVESYIENRFKKI